MSVSQQQHQSSSTTSSSNCVCWFNDQDDRELLHQARALPWGWWCWFLFIQVILGLEVGHGAAPRIRGLRAWPCTYTPTLMVAATAQTRPGVKAWLNWPPAIASTQHPKKAFAGARHEWGARAFGSWCWLELRNINIDDHQVMLTRQELQQIRCMFDVDQYGIGVNSTSSSDPGSTPHTQDTISQ